MLSYIDQTLLDHNVNFRVTKLLLSRIEGMVKGPDEPKDKPAGHSAVKSFGS